MGASVVSERGQSPDACRSAQTMRERKKPRHKNGGTPTNGFRIGNICPFKAIFSQSQQNIPEQKKKKTSGVLDGILLTRYKVSCSGSRHNWSLGRVTNYKPPLTDPIRLINNEIWIEKHSPFTRIRNHRNNHNENQFEPRQNNSSHTYRKRSSPSAVCAFILSMQNKLWLYLV